VEWAESEGSWEQDRLTERGWEKERDRERDEESSNYMLFFCALFIDFFMPTTMREGKQKIELCIEISKCIQINNKQNTIVDFD